ncbi:MAG: ankyrin repeat domain-containing protein [Opitutaceae bacterium]|nr:ankyrin repeat domain-containing protein [Opitutaceae bacterium]
MQVFRWIGCLLLACAGALTGHARGTEGAAKRILFVAGEKSHAPGAHEFPAGSGLLANALNASGLGVAAEVSPGWPGDIAALERADLIVLYSDGLERHVARGKGGWLRARMERGKALAVLHFALEPPADDPELRALLLDATGACFEVNWSVNPIWILKGAPDRANVAARGVATLNVEDEWYYHLRLRDRPPFPLSLLSAVPPVESLGQDGPRSGNPMVRLALERKEPQLLAWTYTTARGARGFGFTGGHFHRNWYNDDFRRLVLNALVWCCGLDVPAGGVASTAPAEPVYATLDEAIARGDADDVKRHLAWDPRRVLGAAGSKMKPLHQAILRRKPDLVALLLDAGASPLTPDSSGRSPLHLAVERGDVGIFRMLLKAGADPTVRDGRGWTPLHHAAAKNQIEIARLLLDAPTDPNILSELGGTPLHEAAASGSVALAKLLVDRGTNPAIRSKPGVTALDIAREYKNTDVIAYLEGLAKRQDTKN